MCKHCFTEKKIEMKTVFTVEYNDCIIVVKNVPCFECPVCGEVTFSDEVSAKLEIIVSAAKKLMQEISVIDYTKAA
ncbi:MAG: type II toxin-antitoxin system MqsA family antitoxin [Lachnospiraceae bacterium]|jgi:YgiT-type zinc finger domain-containing protein|nr:type II toxin-antitoxin system MqsA family antitoxin [Lachnospiraceae bacterium]